ncbi:MAG TPA: hypothetical protein VI485_21125 [Vicinamibacterales bacterium]|nr:hypothetical protein [Vicinamibacterales bacterium]
MAQRVFFLNTLRDGVEPSSYEDWVRRVDYPVARNVSAIRTYVVSRVEGHLDSADQTPTLCQYLEVIEVESIERYRASLDGNADLEALLKEWETYVGSSVAIWGEVLE